MSPVVSPLVASQSRPIGYKVFSVGVVFGEKEKLMLRNAVSRGSTTG